MPNVRQEIYGLGADWSDPVLWYAKGVRAMQAKPITDVTSWTFLAAIHGFEPDLWTSFGYLPAGAALPTPAQLSRYVAKCQHQTWYFLPWHRGYVAAFEAMVRAAIVEQGGPADWALPYWNYNSGHPNALKLPSAFASQTMPDGSQNPLYVSRRYGIDGHGTVVLQPKRIRNVALGDSTFPGDSSSVPPGFGGPETLFHHGDERDGEPSGGVEAEPHNNVHTEVGGAIAGSNPNDENNQGLMSMPNTAALDPIFWLHHANIDRWWDIWLRQVGHENPSSSAWQAGPVGQSFAMPTPTGGDWPFAAQDVLSTTTPTLNYIYDDYTSPAPPPPRQATRLAQLGFVAAQVQAMTQEKPTMAHRQTSEVIGSNDTTVSLSDGVAATTVTLDRPSVSRLSVGLNAAIRAARPVEPDRVFLKLENIRSQTDAALVSVYVGLPPGAVPEDHPDNFVGTISMFGVSNASRQDQGRAGNGVSQVFEITHILDALHAKGGLAGLDHLDVRFVPEALAPGPGASIGKVRILRSSR
jgi:tyrosinase